METPRVPGQANDVHDLDSVFSAPGMEPQPYPLLIVDVVVGLYVDGLDLGELLVNGRPRVVQGGRLQDNARRTN